MIGKETRFKDWRMRPTRQHATRRDREEAANRRRLNRNEPIEDNRNAEEKVRDQIDAQLDDANVIDLPSKKVKKWTSRPENWRFIGEHAAIYVTHRMQNQKAFYGLTLNLISKHQPLISTC